jgi:cellulose synthase/poly-beta-1,6-N-acetylglucosamine synthase-like glycosyltransferase
MNELAIAIFGVLAIFVVLQTSYVLPLVSSFRLPSSKAMPDEWLPKAAVILPLRCADPFLGDCVRALLQQNYPDYKLHIIVDSQKDPAWNIVTQIIQQLGATHVQVSPLIARHKTCSLKGSALVQAINALDDSYQVAAFIDADVVPHSTWLRELVAPLVDERIGATTGNRWYMPQIGQWGSLIRHLFNLGAVVSMYINKYPWGGSMAMRLSVLQQAQLLKIWRHSISVDSPVWGALQNIGLKVKFVPTVMMSNREECDLAQCWRFIQRQLLVSRLYHPTWRLAFFQVLTFTSTLAVGIALLLIAVARSNFTAAAWVGSGIVGYILAMAVLLILAEQAVRRVIRANGQKTQNFSFPVIAKILLAIPLMQLVVTLAGLSTMLKRKVEWRGVIYQIKDPYNIQLIEHHPSQVSLSSFDSKTSIG